MSTKSENWTSKIGFQMFPDFGYLKFESPHIFYLHGPGLNFYNNQVYKYLKSILKSRKNFQEGKQEDLLA